MIYNNFFFSKERDTPQIHRKFTYPLKYSLCWLERHHNETQRPLLKLNGVNYNFIQAWMRQTEIWIGKMCKVSYFFDIVVMLAMVNRPTGFRHRQ